MSNLNYVIPSLSNKLSDYELINDLTEGWKAIVGNSTKYLPKEPKESNDSYLYRLNKAMYSDMFNPTINGLSGLIFKNPIAYEVPSQLNPLIENADNMGNHMDLVLENLFDIALRKGISFALVDIPKADNVQSRADEIAMGIRPYIVVYNPEQITSWKTKTINGQIVLSQVKILETIQEDDPSNPYKNKEVKQYRVLGIGPYEVYRIGSDSEELISSGTTGLDYIPLVSLNLDKKAFFEARIPFYDLGKMNIAHYQISTDMRHSAHTASVPFYFMAGMDKEELKGFKIAPNSILTSQQVDAKLTIIDYDGKGVEVGRGLNQDIENKIREMALSVISQDKELTATEVNISNTKNQSKLNKWVRLLIDCAENILLMSAKYYKLNDGGSIAIDADIIKQPLDAQEVTALNNMVSANNLSVETMWAIIESGRMELPSEFDPDLEKERLSENGLLTNGTNT